MSGRVPQSVICERAFEFACRTLRLGESGYWLRVALKIGAAGQKEVEWELSEANQLLAMIIAAIRTAQSSGGRGQRGDLTKP
jgi:hypothetical protein